MSNLIITDVSTDKDRIRDKEYAMDLKMRYAVQELNRYEFEIKEKDNSLICDCHLNYGRACKKPDKYKTGGCK